MWDFAPESEVKAVNGFTAVAKKHKPHDPTLTPQRKIIAANGANYWWCDPTIGSSAVLRAGEMLGKLYSPSDDLYVSQWDEEQCFSYGETPEWFWGWLACPPV